MHAKHHTGDHLLQPCVPASLTTSVLHTLIETSPGCLQAKRKYQEAQGQVRSLQGDNDELRSRYAQKAQCGPLARTRLRLEACVAGGCRCVCRETLLSV